MLLDNDPLLEPVAEDGEPDASQRPRAGQEYRAELVEAGERERFTARWQEIQTGFVDEPKRAVQDADRLVVDLMQRLALLIAGVGISMALPTVPTAVLNAVAPMSWAKHQESTT